MLKRAAVISFLLSAIIVTGGCSNTAQDQHLRNLELARHYLDHRDYEDAINLLESELIAFPNDQDTATLLAQAHLGMIGFELLDFIKGVVSDQGGESKLDLMFVPRCDGSVVREKGYDLRCLLYKVINRLPDPEDTHLLRAKKLLRSAWSNPIDTPIDVNFMMTFVEWSSALGRVRLLLDRATLAGIRDSTVNNPQAFPFHFVVHHLKAFLDEAVHGLVRARFSYKKISKYIVEIDGMPLVTIGDRSVVFDENIGLPAFLRFAVDVLHDQSDSTNKELSGAAEDLIRGIGLDVIEILKIFDRVEFYDKTLRNLEVFWQFENLLQSFLGTVTAGTQDIKINFVQTVWENPPEIVRALGLASKKAWDDETAAPLHQYYADTEGAWSTLNTLVLDWNDFFAKSLTPAEKDAISSYIHLKYGDEIDQLTPPAQLTSQNMIEWQNRIVNLLRTERDAVLAQTDPTVPKLAAEKLAILNQLINQTVTWIERNLWGSN